MANNNQKLYQKAKKTNIWGTLIAFIIFSILFVFMMVYITGFFMQYVLESKFAEEYKTLESLAHIYEHGPENAEIKSILDESKSDFVVTDKSGNVVYQKGNDTRGAKKAEMMMSDGNEKYQVYEDSESDILYINDENYLDIHMGKLYDLVKKYSDSEVDVEIENDSDETFKANGVLIDYSIKEDDKNKLESIAVPAWISIDVNGGKETFVGKAMFHLNIRDVVLFIELVGAIILLVVIIVIILLVNVIVSIVRNARLRRLYFQDITTKGHNWVWYLIYGDKEIRKRRNAKLNFAVINLVFKNYRNYALCHSVKEGEEMLTRIHDSLLSELEKKEKLAHTSPSNYALLLKYEDEDRLKMRLHEIIKKLEALGGDHNFVFQLGVDLVESPTNETARYKNRKEIDFEDIYNNACAARMTLGDTDESGIRIFDKKLVEDQKWLDIVQEHQWSALKNEEFKVYYQPKYNPRTNELSGAEALIRWESPEYGFVTPGRIIPLFEKNGFITEIDHYMLTHAARDQKRWLDEGYKCVPVSVNVSRAHFAEVDLAEQIRDTIDAEGCPHELIEIELTESAFFDDKNAMIDTITKLKSYGFKVSMDDFGSGYSSLNSLKDLPLDVLKLDAEFFRGENAGERGEIVVSEAIKLAKSLNMRTVAEGVEEKNQVDFLAEQGCDMIQGYYYAKPMPGDEYMSRMTK